MLFYPLVFGWWEVLIIAFVILLIFGGKKIPELMKGLGKGVKSFKEGINEIDEQIQSSPADHKEPSDGAKPADKE
jgi:sec-independent protein translocase protein TatA